MPVIRKPFDRERSPTELNTDGGADQAAAGDTNINNIMAKYVDSGAVTHVSRSVPLYGDFSEASDLHTATNNVIAAQAAFDALPSEIRAAADNDATTFLAMVQDDDGATILHGLGLEIEGFSPLPSVPPEETPVETPPETPPPEA